MVSGAVSSVPEAPPAPAAHHPAPAACRSSVLACAAPWKSLRPSPAARPIGPGLVAFRCPAGLPYMARRSIHGRGIRAVRALLPPPRPWPRCRGGAQAGPLPSGGDAAASRARAVCQVAGARTPRRPALRRGLNRSAGGRTGAPRHSRGPALGVAATGPPRLPRAASTRDGSHAPRRSSPGSKMIDTGPRLARLGAILRWKRAVRKGGAASLPGFSGGDPVSTRVAKPKARAVLANGARKFTVGKAQKPTTTLSSLSPPKASA